MHKSVHKSYIPDSYTLLLFIVKSYLFKCFLMSDMYVCMHVCTKSFLKNTTNSLCVCAHLVNKADFDSDHLVVNKVQKMYVLAGCKLHSDFLGVSMGGKGCVGVN